MKKTNKSEGRARRLANLKPWPKGMSGNPKGRPKSITLSEAYRKQLAQPFPDDPQGRTYAEVIAEKLVMNAATGEVGSAREIADRTEGKPRQALDVDLIALDWQELAKEFGLDEHEVIREALAIVKSLNGAGGSESD
jgi:hypothetical protein